MQEQMRVKDQTLLDNFEYAMKQQVKRALIAEYLTTPQGQSKPLNTPKAFARYLWHNYVKENQNVSSERRKEIYETMTLVLATSDFSSEEKISSLVDFVVEGGALDGSISDSSDRLRNALKILDELSANVAHFFSNPAEFISAQNTLSSTQKQSLIEASRDIAIQEFFAGVTKPPIQTMSHRLIGAMRKLELKKYASGDLTAFSNIVTSDPFEAARVTDLSNKRMAGREKNGAKTSIRSVFIESRDAIKGTADAVRKDGIGVCHELAQFGADHILRGMEANEIGRASVKVVSHDVGEGSHTFLLIGHDGDDYTDVSNCVIVDPWAVTMGYPDTDGVFTTVDYPFTGMLTQLKLIYHMDAMKVEQKVTTPESAKEELRDTGGFQALEKRLESKQSETQASSTFEMPKLRPVKGQSADASTRSHTPQGTRWTSSPSRAEAHSGKEDSKSSFALAEKRSAARTTFFSTATQTQGSQSPPEIASAEKPRSHRRRDPDREIASAEKPRGHRRRDPDREIASAEKPERRRRHHQENTQQTTLSVIKTTTVPTSAHSTTSTRYMHLSAEKSVSTQHASAKNTGLTKQDALDLITKLEQSTVQRSEKDSKVRLNLLGKLNQSVKSGNIAPANAILSAIDLTAAQIVDTDNWYDSPIDQNHVAQCMNDVNALSNKRISHFLRSHCNAMQPTNQVPSSGKMFTKADMLNVAFALQNDSDILRSAAAIVGPQSSTPGAGR